jgi:hypothetical protein
VLDRCAAGLPWRTVFGPGILPTDGAQPSTTGRAGEAMPGRHARGGAKVALVGAWIERGTTAVRGIIQLQEATRHRQVWMLRFPVANTTFIGGIGGGHRPVRPGVRIGRCSDPNEYGHD